MEAVPIIYLRHVIFDPDEVIKIDGVSGNNESSGSIDSSSRNKSKLYKGPAHIIEDPSHFPSISDIVNESKHHTGIYIPDQYCQDFDRRWHSSAQALFGKDPNHLAEWTEFLETGQSNGRRLQLQVMVLPPGMFFKIHAHPNIEFELTLKGCLEEFRFIFRVPREELQEESPKGPNITKEQLFQHFKVEAGKCMINEVGSVHQSYTGNEEECALIVLWSGCHANTRPEQVADDVDPNLQPKAGW
ncbi:hypothetical protein IV203_019062 [Nitzschia inconspicua]|uniref:Uncharacterized protein n=1 Tax=Nitzschia inconspicua TaxID=303405 RepID=A0A9K3LYH1_9STRA|nr:hypothetical protein IV203_019062 [Nitzschia inconspicua]